MRNLFLKYLDGRNITYNAQRPNVISFSYLEHNYIMIYNPSDDPNYIRFCLPDIESADIDDNIRQKMIRLNSEYKVAKIIQVDNQVWISGESFVYNYISIQNLFDRMLTLLHTVLVEYRNS